MDIGLLYQEYQRERESSTAPQQHHRGRRSSSNAGGALFRGIAKGLPRLLAPSSPGSSCRLSASLPPSASDQPWPTAAASAAAAAAAAAAASAAAAPASPPVAAAAAAVGALPPRHHSRPAAVTRYIYPDATAAAAAAAPAARPSLKGGRGRQQPMATVDAAGRRDSSHPLVVIDPKEVQSVLTQVVTDTMRDLLGKSQDAREKHLLRQIRRALSEFETSMSAIVKNVAGVSRPQPDGQRSRLVNNSADSCAVLGAGAGVCASGVVCIGAGAAASRDSGQSIRSSCCCSSDECGTASTRVPLGDSDSDCALPLRYRPPINSLGCPGCTPVGNRRSRHQRNFNHASGNSTVGSRSSNSSSNGSTNSNICNNSSRIDFRRQTAPVDVGCSDGEILTPVRNSAMQEGVDLKKQRKQLEPLELLVDAPSTGLR